MSRAAERIGGALPRGSTGPGDVPRSRVERHIGGSERCRPRAVPPMRCPFRGEVAGSRRRRFGRPKAACDFRPPQSRHARSPDRDVTKKEATRSPEPSCFATLRINRAIRFCPQPHPAVVSIGDRGFVDAGPASGGGIERSPRSSRPSSEAAMRHFRRRRGRDDVRGSILTSSAC